MGIGIKLQRLKTEDFIWVVYIFIAIAAIVSNHFEKDYILTKNLKNQKKFKVINITIFCIAFFIYLYFVLLNYENISDLKRQATKKEVITAQAGLIAALLFLVGGIINLFVEINQNTPDEDIGLI